MAHHLKSVDVSLSAYDPSFQSDIKLYVHYRKEDFVFNARFAPMSSTSPDGSKTLVDHAKLDEIERNVARRPSVTGRFCSAARRLMSYDEGPMELPPVPPTPFASSSTNSASKCRFARKICSVRSSSSAGGSSSTGSEVHL